MVNLIRKLSIGSDLKNGKHWVMGKEVFDGHYISNIIVEYPEYKVYIKKGDEEKVWQAGVSQDIRVEYNLEY